MSRPRRLVVVLGTATEIGKTWTTAALVAAARQRRLTVAARKPAQSFEPGTGPTDAEILADAAGVAPEVVCPSHRWYSVPMAPPMAAAALGLPVPTMDELLGELDWPDDTADVGFVESAGGVRSPVAADGDGADLARALKADMVVVVADAGLGTINAVRSALDALDGLAVLVWLNRYDPVRDAVHEPNANWLHEVDGAIVVTDFDDLATRVLG